MYIVQVSSTYLGNVEKRGEHGVEFVEGSYGGLLASGHSTSKLLLSFGVGEVIRSYVMNHDANNLDRESSSNKILLRNRP